MADFNEKHNSNGPQEKKINGFKQWSLFSQSSIPRGFHDHDWIQKFCVAEEEEKEMVKGLMQNCDLPPPLKLFPMGQSSLQHDEKLALLKALKLSQIRAREAEKKAILLAEERDRLTNKLQEESLRLFAHRQWVRLLDLEVVLLRSQKQQFQQQQLCHGGCYYTQKRRKVEARKEDDMGGWKPWFMALALFLGFASLGMLFGYRNFYCLFW
ncbi:uncharacterized protein LOC122659083 [Telopea speciosissima]|uniref:uncharacterized protein LOC122659083 n=1 Tax=Telopea speciosissima TaxID=54955 RepID=UPI001CC36506|nr:uncharacterized protein LOC122659083 [Telopea speciosissima]